MELNVTKKQVGVSEFEIRSCSNRWLVAFFKKLFTTQCVERKWPDFDRIPEPISNDENSIGEPCGEKEQTNNRSSLHQYSSSYKFHTPSPSRAFLTEYTFLSPFAGLHVLFLYPSSPFLSSFLFGLIRWRLLLESFMFTIKLVMVVGGGKLRAVFCHRPFWSIIIWLIVSTRLDRFFPHFFSLFNSCLIFFTLESASIFHIMLWL